MSQAQAALWSTRVYIIQLVKNTILIYYCIDFHLIPQPFRDGVRMSRRSRKSRASRSTVRFSVVVAESSRVRDWDSISPPRMSPAPSCCSLPAGSAFLLWLMRLLFRLLCRPVWFARIQTNAKASVTAEQRTMSTTHTAITTCSNNQLQLNRHTRTLLYLRVYQTHDIF